MEIKSDGLLFKARKPEVLPLGTKIEVLGIKCIVTNATTVGGKAVGIHFHPIDSREIVPIPIKKYTKIKILD
jgi:hypothetical protein